MYRPTEGENLAMGSVCSPVARRGQRSESGTDLVENNCFTDGRFSRTDACQDCGCEDDDGDGGGGGDELV